MRCPHCNFLESKVVDSRRTDDEFAIRRRRECLKCEQRFTTYEKVEKLPLVVVKKSGAREIFDRSKVFKGLLRASEKRPVPVERLEGLVDDVEKALRNSMEREVSSQLIGELVMERLRDVDEVAYVRFASVYRQFSDVGKFFQELQDLMDNRKDGRDGES